MTRRIRATALQGCFRGVASIWSAAVVQRVVTVAFVALTLLLSLASRAHAEPQRTTVGVYVNQVTNIDLKGNAFTIDFWLWFRSAPHTTPSPLDTFELIDGRVNA